MLNNVIKWLTLLAMTMCSNLTLADISIQLTSLIERQALASGVSVTQLGDFNIADVTQSGSGHYAVLLQQGILNQLILQQRGFGNQAEINQFGNNNSAHIIQSGHDNLIRLEQWGNQHFTIEQSGVGAEISIIQY